MITIKDISKATGYSITTVSFALNGKPSISDKTRKLIWDKANELGYFPNASARNLKRKATKVIGFFLPIYSGPIYSDIINSLSMYAADHGYTVITCLGQFASKMIMEQQVDVAVIMDDSIKLDMLRNQNSKINIPIFFLDRKVSDDENVFSYTIDNQSPIVELTKKLINTNHKRIAYIKSSDENSFDSNERYQAFVDTCISENFKDYTIYTSTMTDKGAYDLTRKNFFDNNRFKYDAVICSNDQQAIGVYMASTEVGASVPEDFSLTGFDDILLGNLIATPLSTVKVNRETWGELLGKQIIDYLTKDILPQKNKKMSTTFILRQSVMSRKQ